MPSNSPQPAGEISWYFLLYYSLLDHLWAKRSRMWNKRTAAQRLIFTWCSLIVALLFWAKLLNLATQHFLTSFFLLVLLMLFCHEFALKKAQKWHNLRANLKYYQEHKQKIACYKYLFFFLIYGNLLLSIYWLNQDFPHSAH